MTLITLDVYKWTLAAHFFIPLESVRSNPKVVRILSTMWAVSIIIMSVVYTATNKPYNHHLSPGHRLSSNNPGNVKTTPGTLDVYDSRTKLQNKDSRKQFSLDKCHEFSNSYLETGTLTLAVATQRNKRVILTDVLSSTEYRESQEEKEPLIRQQKDWYNGQALDKNNEAHGHLKADITHKTKKENLKPRKTSSPRVQLIQGNLQKSRTGQIELNKRISSLNKKGEKFVCLIQEPYTSLSRIINQPNSVQKFAAKGLARAAIYISKNTPAWFIEYLSNTNLVVV